MSEAFLLQVIAAELGLLCLFNCFLLCIAAFVIVVEARKPQIDIASLIEVRKNNAGPPPGQYK